MAFDAHVRDEVATRELLGRIGDGKELGATNRMKSWCSEVVLNEWHFQGVDHVVLALKKTCGIAPCRKCLEAIRAVINNEIGG